MPPHTEPSSSADHGIRLESVVLERGAQRVFDGLSLALREARIGVIGDNGAGKSSLFRLVSGLEQPLEGLSLIHI